MKRVTSNSDTITDFMKQKLTNNNNISSHEGILIDNFSTLMKEVAEMSFINKDFMLFFRGQDSDFKNQSGISSSLYPRIYRERLKKKDDKIEYRYQLLNKAAQLLCGEVENMNIIGRDEILNKRYVQWAILQHYEICDTPLLDITHSLRVACSFALRNNRNEFGYIYTCYAICNS